MRVLVLGAAGMLGSDVVLEVSRRQDGAVGIDVADLDITDPTAVARIGAGELGDFDWCVNCAAYTAVDKAEAESDLAMLVNGIAPGYIGQACAMKGIRLLHVSTDFVFDGAATSPYAEDAETNPLGAYGASKLAGESAVRASGADALIVRTAWLYGPNGGSFPRTMIKAWLAGRELRVVNDQIGSPTYTGDLARVLCDLMEVSPQAGIYHAAGADIVSWHEVALRAIRAYQRLVGDSSALMIEAIKTDDWPTPAKRPKYSALSFDKIAGLGIEPMRRLDDALAEFATRLEI